MSPDLDALLCARYPRLFANRHDLSGRSSFHWGFEHDDGWFLIIAGLSSKLQSAADAGRIPQPVVTQVKQKFAELRFYVSARHPEISALVEAARQRSAITCEICGAPGSRRASNGVKTLCDDHFVSGLNQQAIAE